MSGIGAIFNLDGAPVARDHLERMANALRMHGPDGRAVAARGPIGLVHTLHRFTPEDAFERQPVTGGGGRYLMVMDGRIDNRDDLAAALALGPAPRLARLPDSALFMRAVEAWGEEGCLNRIVGEFAIALWDHREQRLLCARDHLGLRPLHYHRTERCLAVASMPKGLHALPWVPRELNEQKLADYLVVNFCDGASSYFRDVRRLLMAHVMTASRGGSVSLPGTRGRPDRRRGGHKRRGGEHRWPAPDRRLEHRPVRGRAEHRPVRGRAVPVDLPGEPRPARRRGA
jgi:asparagine synthase (glutamine-hydrolysing)